MTEKKYTMRDVYQRVYADTGIVPVHAMWLDGKTFTEREFEEKVQELEQVLLKIFEDVDKEIEQKGDDKP
ncbi:hypothetical protein [Limosilactobacillus mucosae]|uniref:hypothetical protein n=1 Tax=Limosilactobacillus mucosae TaxID=97478 RepID=UPI0022E4BB23|nr:hypothetical protein [Limosilactobacillus mucosae]